MRSKKINAILLMLSLLVGVICVSATNFLARPAASGGGSPPASPQLTETYEGSNSGYDLVWSTDGSGLLDPDYATSPAPLAGSHSLLVTNTTAGGFRSTYRSIGASRADWYLMFMFVPVSTTGELTICDFWDSGFAPVMTATLLADNTVTVMHGTVASTATVGTMTDGTTYYIKIYFNNTSNSASLEFSTTPWTFTGSGNNFTSLSGTGDAANDADRVRIGLDATDFQERVIYDNVYVDADGL